MTANVLNRVDQPDADGDNVYQFGGTVNFGATAHGGLLFGAGTSSAKYEMGTTANKSMVQLFGNATATSGDARNINARLYFSGVGGSGEVVRAYGIVNGVTAATGGTVNGIHASLAVSGAAGAVSGAGNAIRATLELGASTTAGGTLSAIQLDSFFDTAATVPTTAAAIRVTDTGVKLWANLASLPATGSGLMIAPHTTQVMTDSIRILVGGAIRYIMLTTAATNRTGGA
jgi:hypothetical protein